MVIEQCSVCGAMVIDYDKHDCNRLLQCLQVENSDGHHFDTMLPDQQPWYGIRLRYGFAALHGDSRE